MGIRNVSIRYYAKGNVGTSYPSEDISYVAGIVREILEESRTFAEAKEKIEQNEDIQEWLSEPGREIELNEWYVKISDKLLDRNRNSHGYEYAEIFLDDTFEKLEDDRRRVLSWIENSKGEKFRVITDIRGNYAVEHGFIPRLDEIEKSPEGFLVSKENFIECVNGFFEYLKADFEENGTPAEQARPICSNNPYAWGEPGWKVELYENKIVLNTKYQDLAGAEYHTFAERIEIYIVNDSKKCGKNRNETKKKQKKLKGGCVYKDEDQYSEIFGRTG